MRRGQAVRLRVLVSAFPGSNPGASDKKEFQIETITSIILAAGKGVRMNSELPKVLHQLKGRPLVMHVIDNLKKAGSDDIIAIVGYKGELVSEAVKGKAKIVWQREQLGTGHAVMQAEAEMKGREGTLIVACGDVPLIKPETFRLLLGAVEDKSVKASVLTMNLANPTGYGRIMKDPSGKFIRIIEEKDASDEEKKISEVNTGTYAFDAKYLFEGLKKIDTNNAQREYYLPDALRHIISAGYTVKTICLEDPIEGSGVNSPDELNALEKYLDSRN